jgi:ATP-dependent Zn protease
MQPDVWGKYLWVSIHLIALGYPMNPSSEDKNNYIAFFESLKNVIPCYKCSENYKKNLLELPLTFDNTLKDRLSLFKWTVDLHNIVNKETNKPTISYDQAEKIYTKYLVEKNEDVKKIFKKTMQNNTNVTLNRQNDKYNIYYHIIVSILLFFVICLIVFLLFQRFNR